MLNILIAEDDNASRKILQSFLEPYGGCRVTTNGLEAIDAYNSMKREGGHFDLICLDIMMPKVDGVKVLEIIRESEKRKAEDEFKTIILMITALGKTQLVKEAIAFGCDGYLTKPILREELIELIASHGLIGR
jgi:two-component system chemotaxis response regulator CheY